MKTTFPRSSLYHRRKKSSSFVLKALPSALALVFSQPGWAVDPTINVGGATGLPLNGTVASGVATGSVAGNQLTIDQTSGRAVIDWTSFNIDAGKSVLFNQPTASSAVLNRVNGDANASQIMGNLSANGTVMLMNPNGIMFGANSVVNVGSLVATTGTINQSEFENHGHAHITGAAGSITNLGHITATAGASGLVALVAPSVINQKSITATGGQITLAGSTAATISLNGGLYEFAIPTGATGVQVSNTAAASLNAANIHIGVGDAANLLSGVINLEGVQQATNAIVVNGHTVELKSALQAPSVSGNSATVNVSSGARIQDAVDIAKTGLPGAGATVNVGAGTYAEQVVLNKANMTMAGAAGAKIVVPDAAEVNGVRIQANNVTVSGMEIAGPVSQPYYQYYAAPAPSNISRGIAVADGVTGFTIRNNNIHDVRNGILIHGRNSTGSVTDNRIENTKSGISVQYTDGAGITMAGNIQGPVGNEWGLNLHLNGHLDGSNNILSNTTPIAAAPTLTWQQSLLDLSTANGGWSVQDQAYTSSNRTHANVATTGSAGVQGSVLTPLGSIQDGINAVVVGGRVNVAAGSYTGSVALNKSDVIIAGGEGANLNVAEGQTGFDISANGVTVEGMQITGPYSQNFTTVNWNAVPTTTGIMVRDNVSGARIRNNTIKNVRTGVQVLDHAVADITGNTFDNTKGSILLRSDHVTMSGNTRGSSGNEWDIVFLNRVTDGAYFVSPHVSQTQYGSDMMTMSRANGDMHILDRRYGSNGLLGSTPQFGNRSHIVVSAGSNFTAVDDFNLGNGLGNARQPLGFIGDGINAVVSGGVVEVKAGTYAENVNINKALTLDGAGMEQTILRAPTASGNAVTITGASDVTLSDLAIADSGNGLLINGTSNNVTVNRVAFNNNRSGIRTGKTTRADNFRMLNSTITGGEIGVQTYNGVGATGSFANALFENVTIDGPTFKGFYFETANNLTLKDVTITNTGNYGAPATSDDHMKYGAAIDINLKYDDFNAITLQNVVVKDSGHSSGNDTRAAVVIKTRGIPGDSSYAAAPASLQSVNIIGGSIEGSSGTGIRFETLSNGSGGQPAVTISGGARFSDNGQDIVVGNTRVDATGAVFVGAANGFAVEDRVTHALDSATRGLVTWTAGNVYVTQNSGSIQRGVNAASAGHTVNVGAGTFAEQVVLDKADMTLAGSEGAKIVVPDLAEVNGVRIQANNVTVSGMEIAGPVDQPYLSYAWGSNISRGVAVGNGVTGFNIRNNNIHDVRNGILIDGRNTGSVTGNRIDNTKSGISVQYTDGTGITISGNTQGTLGNEWGLNLHLNGHMVGSNIVSNSTPISTDPTLGWQESLLGLSTANNGWSVQDQAYTSSNRTHVAVAATGSASSQGSQLTPLNTVQAGVNAVVTGGTVNVAAGTYVQPATLLVNKSLTLAGAGQGDTTIDARGVSGYGIQVTADDVTLRDFTLYGPSANVASSYGIKVAPAGPGASARLHDFSISNVTIRGSGRAELDLNGVDRALIDHVTADGAPVGNDSGTTQGAGIQLTDSANVTVRNSTTRNNSWGGLALYQANRHYNQQVNNITVEGSNNFTEVNPVYMQDESASRDFGALNIAGFDYAVRNASQDQYTWLQATQQKAFDFGVNLGDASSSYVQGWNGTAATQDFQVGVGNLAGGGTQALSINTALSHAADGANIRVGTGRYAENVALSNPYNLYFSGSTVGSLTLHAGASGTGISGSVTADGAGGFLFNAPIRLLGDTTLATQGANITFNGDIQNADGVARALRLVAGSGGTRGNVHMTTGGSASSPLGQFDVSANQFSLASTLWVKGYKIDALGNVTLSNNTLRAQDAGAANTLNAGGNVTGSTISQGSVAVVSAGDIAASIAGTNVVAQAQGAMDVVVTASQTASLTADTIVANITATDVVAQSQGNMNVVVSASSTASLAGNSVVANVTAPVVGVEAVNDAQISGSASQITLDAPKGSVSGSFGQVSNTGGGLVNVNGKPQGNQTLSSNSENSRVVPVGEVGSGNEPGVRVARVGSPTAQRDGDVSLSTPEAAGDAIDSGQAVELDLSPRKSQDAKEEKSSEKEE